VKPLCVAFLWHMHQPMYKDPATARYLMPWVRLHACKSYFDMVDLLEDFPDVRLTFNLVPSLVAQLEDYAANDAQDPFLTHFLKPADSLTEPERRFLLQNFFMANWNTVVRRHGRYWQLLYKRGTSYTARSDIDELKFTVQDYRDLQVWHNLAWFGFRARRKYPQVAELIAKGQHFTEEDKQTILALQLEIIRRVIPLYREALARGQIEITTSPFYHPIMPLVMSTENAVRASADCRVPTARFEHPEDVRVQLEHGLALHRSVFGERPKGLWPPEGAVCPEMVPLIRKAGFDWMVSDEEVLGLSLPQDAGRHRSQVLYRPYRVVHNGDAVDMLFRDRELADAVGFHYMAMRAGDAVDHFAGQLRAIREGCETAVHDYPDTPVVSMFLDGENPWEAYPNDGEDFLNELYRRLSAEPGVRTIRVSDYLNEFPPKHTLEHLHPGSWINHNFNVWIGHPEENEAWDSLAGARAVLVQTQACAGAARASRPTVADLERAWEAVYIAEGSDWFWWYGDDFTSDNDAEFDNLFRTHLMNAYRFAGAEIPRALAEPIKRYPTVAAARDPTRFIAPIIDGKRSNFYEWEGAGVYEARRPSGAMHQREAYIEQINYGFDLETLYLRISYRNPAELGAFVDEKYRKQFRIAVELRHAREYVLEFIVDLDEVFSESGRPKIPRDEMITYHLSRWSEDDKVLEPLAIGNSLRTDVVTELSVGFRELGLKAGDRVELAVTMYPIDLRGRAVSLTPVERCPKKGNIHFTVPDEFFELDNWVV
jgi:alpha-amylase/alpha-mannosidase (GH57 family)